MQFIWDMKPETKLKFTKRNAAAIDKYAAAFLAQFFACTIFFTAPVLAREMPWNREVTVTAHVMWRKGWPALKFAEPLDLRTNPADPEHTRDLRNVRVVPVVAEVDLDFRLLEKVIKSGRSITVTGSFKPATNVRLSKRFVHAFSPKKQPPRTPAPATPWYNQPWAQPVPQYNAA